MKMLSWMRTIKRIGLNPSKESKGGFLCLGSQVSAEVQEVRTNSFSFSFSKSSHDPKQSRVEEESRFDEDGFCGFLAIGTLGADPETPKFSTSVGTEEKGEIGKVIAEKLGNFLEDNSGSKLVRRSDSEGDKDSIVRQGYNPFRSSTEELTERTNGGVGSKKGLLTSLFKRNSSMEKYGTQDLVKKILKKLHGSSTNTRFYDKHKKKDLRKSVQILGRKVHPVLSTPARDDNKMDDIRRVPSSIFKANGKRETWIKTDAEYHVLEL